MLSQRLETIRNLLPTDTKRLVDVGCDHAYLAEAFLQGKPDGVALLIDRLEGPLAKAADTMKAYLEDGRATISLADGLSDWQPQRGDTVVIAGMGGKEIQKILLNFAEMPVCSDQEDFELRIVWQAMRDQAYLRRSLRDCGGRFISQKLVEDKSWVYSVDSTSVTCKQLRKMVYTDSSDEPKDWLGDILLTELANGRKDHESKRWINRQIRIAKSELPGFNGEKKRLRERLIQQLQAFVEGETVNEIT